jgi:hypothetical protein
MGYFSIPDPARDEIIGGVGISIGSMQSVARRQLAGSIVAAAAIVAFATLTAVRSERLDPSYTTAHAHRGVQQPSFATTPSHLLAAAKHQVETP